MESVCTSGEVREVGAVGYGTDSYAFLMRIRLPSRYPLSCIRAVYLQCIQADEILKWSIPHEDPTSFAAACCLVPARDQFE